jgi:DNA-binding transcriptional MerR regulator
VRAVNSPTDQGYLRIGELSRRVGVAPDTLRAWERRYGMLRPQRTQGGFRLYSDADVGRVRAMLRHLEDGLAPAQAARRALEEAPAAGAAPAGDPIADLRVALEGFDESAAQEAIDRVLATLEMDSVVSHVFLPYLRDLGDRWEAGEISVAQEHFASAILRSRLLEQSRGWDRGDGPRAMLACAPGELHDLPLICLGLALRSRGWRITMLGADTPLESLVEAVSVVRPEVVVVSAMFDDRLDGRTDALRMVAERVPLVLAGPVATAAVAGLVGARLEQGDPVTVAARLTGLLGTGGATAGAVA